jgi:hypothetical protein
MLRKLLKLGYDIHITCEYRRTDKDSSGKKLPNGRDNYGLYNYKLNDGEKTIENEWPGFYDYNDMLKDIKDNTEG